MNTKLMIVGGGLQMSKVWWIFPWVFPLFAGLIGCGGGSKPSTPIVLVTISPSSTSVPQGGTQSFTAHVIGTANPAVGWSVLEAAGGSITSAGLYTAPNATGTFHVVATSQADSSKSATALVTVPTTPTFSSTGSLAQSQLFHATTLLPDGRVLVSCGFSGAAVLSEAELFDPASGTFRSLAATPRLHCTATLLQNGKVLIVGGLATNNDQTASNTAELFDPATGLFQPTGNMASARFGHSATLLSDGRVLIAGGGNQTAEIYDPAADTFVPTGQMSVARGGHTATLLADGKVLVAGGSSVPGGDPLGTAELYDSSSGMFSPTGSLVIPRSGHTATLLPNGKVFFAGGVPGPTDDNPFAPIDPRTELFDPATGQFSNAGNMTAHRIRQTATLLADGTVFLVGGWVDAPEGYHTTTSAEIYDPARSSFTAASLRLAESRGYHSATLLADGRVLVTGGTHAEPPGPVAVLNTAEIYIDPCVAACCGCWDY